MKRNADSDWPKGAICASTDPEIFFATNPVGVATAKRICRDCPVRDECLSRTMEDEMFSDVRFGVFGGLDPRERQHLASPASAVSRYSEQLRRIS